VDTGPFVFFLTEADGTVLIGDDKGLNPAPADLEIEKAANGKVTSAKGWNIFSARDVNSRSAEIDQFTVPVGPEGVYIKKLGLGEAFQGRATITYDPATDTLTDSAQGKVYRADDELGSFVNVNDPTDVLATGWRVGVGFKNFTRVFTDPQVRGPFFGIFAWTFVFAFMSVLTTFVLGLLLALVMNHPRLRGQKIYRSLLLIPYAIPAFVSLPVWASMFNKDYGLINNVLNTNLDWFGDPTLAKIAVILTNLWLGFPYMFLVITGALQAIPGDLTEAATVDGASSRTAFRTVVFPLLLVSVAPLLISSFAFNFNNFNVIQLLTEGGPFPPDNPTAGGTDILISYTYRLAFGAQGAQFGFAAAISMVIFFLVATISAISFRRTKVLEELN
jgi:arabinogalactan oligomer/maltooligosaccharide transport system permease protein